MLDQLHHPQILSRVVAHRLATGLGWFSIALGVTELVAARQLTRALGMRGNEELVQAYGLREVATGIGILASRNPAPWVWARVAGDALDIATLAAGLRPGNPQRENVVLALASVVGVTALDVLCAEQLSARQDPPPALRDYSDRTGFTRPPEAMRGAARDAPIGDDMREPKAMRPAQTAGSANRL